MNRLTTFYPFRFENDPMLRFTTYKPKLGEIRDHKHIAWIGKPRKYDRNPNHRRHDLTFKSYVKAPPSEEIVERNRIWQELMDKGWGNWDKADLTVAEQMPQERVRWFIKPRTLAELRERLKK